MMDAESRRYIEEKWPQIAPCGCVVAETYISKESRPYIISDNCKRATSFSDGRDSQAAEQARKLATYATEELGWDGVNNSKILSDFIIQHIEESSQVINNTRILAARTIDRLKGELDAAEQHVKILSEPTRATPEARQCYSDCGGQDCSGLGCHCPCHEQPSESTPTSTVPFDYNNVSHFNKPIKCTKHDKPMFMGNGQYSCDDCDRELLQQKEPAPSEPAQPTPCPKCGSIGDPTSAPTGARICHVHGFYEPTAEPASASGEMEDK